MRVSTRHAVTVKAVLELDEEQLRALDALVGYGADSFLKVFYANLGKAYMEPHENGLRSLFKAVNEVVPRALSDARTARELLNQKHNAPPPSRAAWTFPKLGWWKP